MSTIDRYRALFPAHASVPTLTVSAWLELAAAAHDGNETWGAVYEDAMCAYAAAYLDPLVQAGQIPLLAGQGVCAPVVAKTGKSAVIDENGPYWRLYLHLRSTLSESGPGVVFPGTGTLPWPAIGWAGWSVA